MSQSQLELLGMAPQRIPPLPMGAKSPMDAVNITMAKNASQQNALGKTGGRRMSRRRMSHRRMSHRRRKTTRRLTVRRKTHTKKRRGGSATIVVPNVSTNGVPDNGATMENIKALTQSTVNQTIQSGYDKCAGLGPGCTAQVQQSQSSLKGGRKNKGLYIHNPHKRMMQIAGKKKKLFMRPGEFLIAPPGTVYTPRTY